MTPHRRPLTLLGLAAASALALAGCAVAPDAAGDDATDGRLAVVASTSVYAQIAEEIGGARVEVTPIITSDTQDPHSFEPSARDQLTVAEADLILANGGGYDAFIDALIESSGAEAHVITASEFSHDWPENAGHAADEHAADEHAADEHAADEHADGEHAADEGGHGDAGHSDGEHADDEGGHGHVEGFNEHVWYDPHTMAYVADAIAAELGELSPADAETFRANAESFHEQIEGLEDSLAALAAAHGGVEVFITEPVPGYLVRDGGLEDVTPDAFSEAVEEGQDVAPATFLEARRLIESGDVRAIIVNTQTAGAETAEIIGEGEKRGIPVIAFSETLPEGQTYISWMQGNIEALSAALQG